MTERLPPFPGWRCHVNGHVWMMECARCSACGITRRALIADLAAWSTDPDGMDREALENVDRDGWGIDPDA